MIQQIIRNCEAEDWFLHNMFWFFWKIFLISGWIWLKKWGIIKLSSKDYIFVVLNDSMVAFLGEGLFVCLFVWVYDISTFVGYLMSNPFLYK